MEAASARYATRDRFAYPAEPAATPLQRYIQNACSPENFEPNLALCLEIADLINAKKGGAPREAAVAIVGYINHRNPNVSLLALGLLDICVKNCGYPFHLQISTKEFLNELVRRFPERPPVRTTRVQNRILECIEEWRRTICETSKYKEDLGYIRDMHRLLAYKGYVFPEIRREDAAVLNPSDNLKSAEEMEEEERAAQSAKLQELIRRGTPHDLQEANKLMKVMAGYDTRHKTDYRAKAAEEVGRIQQKAKLLEEMLQGYKPGDEIKEGDVYEELASALASAHPKIQRMCEEESEDHEAVAKLFEINDSIHRTIERYKLFKKGDIDGANAIPRGTLGVSGAGVQKGPDNELSLIDFGGPDDAAVPQDPAVTSPKPKGNALEDDLLGLNMGDGNYGQGGGIMLGGSSGASNGTAPPRSTADIMAQFSQPQQPSAPASSIFSSPQVIQQPQSPPIPQASKPSSSLLSSVPAASAPQTSSKPATPVPSASSLAQQHQQAKRSSGTDPFAALSSSSATPDRQPSPAQFQQSIPPDNQSTAPTPLKKWPSPPRVERASTFDLIGMGNGQIPTLSSLGTTPAATTASPRPSTADKKDDEEWTFSSALPDQPTEITVTNSNIKTVFTVTRVSDTELEMRSRISNSTAQSISDLTFQLAVTKGYTLHLQPQSSRNLSANQQNGITQTIRLEGVDRGKGTSVKMRYRASYNLGGTTTNEQGEIVGLGVS